MFFRATPLKFGPYAWFEMLNLPLILADLDFERVTYFLVLQFTTKGSHVQLKM